MDEFSLTKAWCTILTRQSPQEVFAYLQEVLTDKELEYVEKRLRIARLLEEDASYTQIQQSLQVSAATVAQVVQMRQRPRFAQLTVLLKKELEKFAFIKRFLGIPQA